MRDLVKLVGLFGLAGTVALAAACSATSSSDNIFGGGGTGGAGTGGAGGNAATTTTTGGSLITVSAGSGTGTGQPACNSAAGDDIDMDGFPNPTDCNDCDPNVNPNAVEVSGGGGSGGAGGAPYEPADEDCDGQIDEAPDVCDQGLNVADADPLNGARAVELCKMAMGPSDWGVVSAGWVMADGSPAPAGNANFHLGHGLLSGFGPNVTPRAGQRMLGVSSGTARQPSDPGYQSVGGFNKNYTGNHPQGFPKESPACPGVTTGTPHDPTALEIQIRVPSNAQGFSFNFNFYTYEWPGYICSQFNDFFVAILSPIPQGQMDGNISFDGQGNPISVNNAFLDVCNCPNPPCVYGGKSFDCALGTTELQGTGFETGAASSWLKTSAPVEPNQFITIRWGAYDSGDGVLDSTALVDNWEWIAEPGTVVGTVPEEPEVN